MSHLLRFFLRSRCEQLSTLAGFDVELRGRTLFAGLETEFVALVSSPSPEFPRLGLSYCVCFFFHFFFDNPLEHVSEVRSTTPKVIGIYSCNPYFFNKLLLSYNKKNCKHYSDIALADHIFSKKIVNPYLEVLFKSYFLPLWLVSLYPLLSFSPMLFALLDS